MVFLIGYIICGIVAIAAVLLGLFLAFMKAKDKPDFDILNDVIIPYRQKHMETVSFKIIQIVFFPFIFVLWIGLMIWMIIGTAIRRH